MVGAPAESELLRLIPALPLAAAVFHGIVIGLLRRESPRLFVVFVSCGAVLASFVLSVWVLFLLLDQPAGARVLVDELYTWIGAGRFSAELSFQLDPLSAIMILVVTGVGSLIHIYSIGYMDADHRDDKGFQRFFCYLNLFTFSMLALVLGDNFLLMFLGWEGVGLCSYLLIGFWYGDHFNAYCGSKAFIVNRIGDFGFLVGIFLIFWVLADAGTPSVAFRDVAANIGAIAERTAILPVIGEVRLVTLIGLCLFLGACGKSAQIPLYMWLPDAMAGPTPVSALIHAATMVTAGVYMVCRLSFLYAASPTASAVVAWVGALTALFAATIAIAQTDIKKVLAYSTVSQLGYMFLAAGCGGYSAAMFHLATHAFFKALLFLGAGAVILALHHEQDTDRMGGLWRPLFWVWVVFGIAVLAIIGFPGLSGFFSKDEILLSAYLAHDVPGHGALYWIAVGTAGLTAFYMLRVFFRTFHGECRAPREVRENIHEPADTVMFPLYVLAGLSFFGWIIGLPQVYGDMIGMPDSNSLAHFLVPVVGEAAHEIDHSTELRLAGLAVAMAAIGAGLAWLLYVREPELPARIRASFSGLWRLVANKYWVDEAVDAAVVRPLVAFSDHVLFRRIDAGLIDGACVDGTAETVRGMASGVLRRLQSGLAQSYLFLMLVGAIAVVGWLVT
jgi:NADH-quinone oxidoreductase subunit L